MNIETCFSILKRHYGSHKAAAEAVGYRRARYSQFVNGNVKIPNWAEILIRSKAEMVVEENPDLMPVCPQSPEASL